VLVRVIVIGKRKIDYEDEDDYDYDYEHEHEHEHEHAIREIEKSPFDRGLY